MTHVGMIITGIALAMSLVTQGSKGTTGAAAVEGTWAMTSFNGQPPPEGAPELTLTFTGDKYHQTVGGEVNERGTFKVDASKKPMTLDLAITEGGDAGKSQLGIVEVTGDTIRAAFGAPGDGPRPTDFAVKEGVLLFVGKKKKA
jgi:uncharacterized protein (TIGR03067 family)